MTIRTYLSLLPLLLGLPAVWAAEVSDETRIRNSLAVFLPSLEVDSIRPAALPGLYEVMAGPRLIYVSADGRYLVQGTLYDLERHQDLTESRVRAAKARAVEAMGEENMIVYGPKDPAHTITVFTDIDCGYCRKLHKEMARYNADGIRVRYLFYPRAGIGSDSYRKAVSVWCADDRKAALDQAKAGKAVPPRSCDNPVADEYRLGQLMGIRGTPAIVLEDGEVIPGYVPPDRLRKVLDQRKAD